MATEQKSQTIKWVAFAKPNLVLPLCPPLPALAPKPKGFSCCFDKVEGWNPPAKLLKESTKYETSVQLSFSFYNIKTASFFGSTWMGVPVTLKEKMPDVVDFYYGDILYALTRVSDPNCVGIVEIVVTQCEKDSKLLVSQFGCGWTIVHCFDRLFTDDHHKEAALTDIEYGHEVTEPMILPFYHGSPRQLLTFQNRSDTSFTSKLREVGHCHLVCRMYHVRKIEILRDYVDENEIIGRHDVIAGMKATKVILPDETSSKEICCLGHSEAMVKGHGDHDEEEDRGGLDPASILRIPNSASLQHKMTLTIKDFALTVPHLATLESKLRLHMAKLYNVDNNKTIIRNRRIMVGLHNGHTIVNNEMISVPLTALEENGQTTAAAAAAAADSKSRSDDEINLADYSVLKVANKKMASSIDFSSYSNHEFMAVVFVLQVDVVTPTSGDDAGQAVVGGVTKGGVTKGGSAGLSQSLTKRDNKSLLLSPTGSGSDTTSTSVTLGSGVYFPWNGRSVQMKQNIIETSEGTDPVSIAMDKEVQISLSTEDSLCRVLTTSPVFQLPKHAHRHHVAAVAAAAAAAPLGANVAGKKKDAKSAGGDDAKSVRFSQELDSKAVAHAPRIRRGHEENADTHIFCCFDVALLDCHGKGVAHGDYLVNGKKQKQRGVDKSKARDRTASSDSDSSDGKGSGDEKPEDEEAKKKDDEDDDEEEDEEEEEEEAAASRRKGKGKGKGKKSRGDYFRASSASPDEDRFGDRFSDSLVMGTAEYSGIRLNPDLYGDDLVDRDYARPEEDVSFERSRHDRSGRFDVTSERRAHQDSRAHLRSSRDANSILYKSLNSKLTAVSAPPPETHVAGISHAKSRPPSDAAAVAASVPLYTHCSASAYVRELSRSARSALTRFGYGDVLSEARYPDSRDRHHSGNDMRPPRSAPRPTEGQSIDIGVELKDPLAGNEIQIQFAGYSSTQPASSSGYGYAVPKNIYCSYQFYTCLASRTEVMKLIPYTGATGNHTKGGNVITSAVFVRAAADIREEIPLCMNYDIDMTYPQERFEFIDYCSKHNLFVDVWDANSMLLIGQCLIPLKRLLRQGSNQVKFALECDIISTNVGSTGDAFDPSKAALAAVSADTATAVPCSIIPHNQGPIYGEVVGSLQVIVSNIGHKSHRVAPISNGFPGATGNNPSANWRAMESGNTHSAFGDQQHHTGQGSARPRNIVRARPLSESSPQLSKILEDYRHNSGASMRSLASNRDKAGDTGGLYTLNYDEISMLFRRFQGKSKGTVTYSGPLLNLIDTPSWAVVLKKLITVHNKALQMNFDMAEGMRAYGDAKGNITKVGLKEYLSVLFERLGIPVKPEELSVLSHHLVGFTTSTTEAPSHSQSSYVSVMLAEQDEKPPSVSHVTANTPTTITKVVEYCNDQALRLNWVSSSKKFRRLVEKTSILNSAGKVNNINAGDDIGGGGVTEYAELHERLADVDTDGDSMITGKELYSVLHDYLDGSLAANSGSKQENTNHLLSTIELKRIVEQFVIKKRKVEEKNSHTKGVDVRLMESDDNGRGAGAGAGAEISPGNVSLIEFMSFLGSTYVGNISSRLKSILMAKAKTLPGGVSSPLDALKDFAEQVLAKLDMPSQSTTYAATSNSDGSSSSAEDAEYLAKVMSNKKLSSVIENLQALCHAADHAEGGGLTLEQIFKVLDKSKDGNLSLQELTVGLQKYPQFKHVTDAEFKVLFHTLFDRDHDGDVSFPEFRDVIKNYDPNRGCFSEAASKASRPQPKASRPHAHATPSKIGLSTKVSYDAVEVCLRQFGVYDAVSHEQVMRLLVKIANLEAGKTKNPDPSAVLSLAQLFKYLDIDVLGNTRAVNKTCSDVIASLQELCRAATASSDGLSLEQIFKVLDKSKDGNLSVKELTVGLQKYPQFKHVTDAEFKVLFHTLFDRDHDGDVSFPEFKRVIENYDVNTGCFSATKLDDLSAPAGGAQGSGAGHPKTKAFVGTLRALAETEGGIVSLCSYLDKDEDGVIWWEDLVRYLRREKIIVEILSGHGSHGASEDGDGTGPVTYTEQELSDVLAPICIRRQREGDRDRDSSESKGVLVTGMLHIAEQGKVSATGAAARGVQPHKRHRRRHGGEEGKSGDGKEADSDSDSDSAADEGYVAKQYEFSSIAEVEAIEKKIRQVGRLLAAKGVDIAALFVKFDPFRSGTIRNTEFMEILTSMGMYILEHNRAAQEAEESKNDHGHGHGPRRGEVHRDSSTMSRQMQQISNLRRNYENSAPQAARKLISESERVDARRNGGKETYKGRSDFREHLESMALVNMYRQSQKKQMLQRVLSHSLAHTVELFPRFGKTLFFEYPITNPFAHEERFCIEVQDAELRVVTDLIEWQHLRSTVRPCIGDLNPVDPVETEIFDVHVSPSGATQIQILLLPQETFYIPFTLLTLIPYQKSSSSSSRALKTRSRGQAAASRRGMDRYHDEESKFGGADGASDEEEDAEESTMQRSIEIKFISGSHGHVVSILNCNVFPRPFVVNRVMRHYEAGNSILKRQIQLLGYDDPNTVHSNSSGGDHRHQPKGRGGANKLSKFVHCVENGFTSRVVVEWNQTSNDSELDDGYISNSNSLLNIVFRYRCDGYPSVGSFYLLVYNDQYQSSLYEIWEVVVQTCQKIDLIGNIGNINTFDLVVRGDDAKVPVQYPPHQQHHRSNTGNRRCKAYYGSTPTDRMVFQPASVFQLVAGAYNKIVAQYTCTKLGRRRTHINIVDVDTNELVSSWVVCINTQTPVVMKSYDVEYLMANHKNTNNGVDVVLNKKIIFKNPWDISRKFVLISSDETVMRPRSNIMDVTARGTSYLRLAFLPPSSCHTATSNVYLFLNNEEGQTEEAFLFTITYK